MKPLRKRKLILLVGMFTIFSLASGLVLYAHASCHGRGFAAVVTHSCGWDGGAREHPSRVKRFVGAI